MKVTVFLADSRNIFMKGLTALLQKEKGLSIITEAEQGKSIVECIIRRQPDVFIYDIDNGEINGFPMLGEVVKKCGDHVRAIALSDCIDENIIGKFFYRGGWGYELKSCPEKEITIAIRCVSRGKHFVCSSLAGEYLKDGLCASPSLDSDLLKKLTPTERKVLAIIRNGGSAKDAALQTSMAVRTVEKHIEHIMGKLEIHSLPELKRRLLFTKLD
jgi:DNA-binding NarL/FixJ family response regulator